MGTDGMEVRERYRDILLENIDYDVLIQNPQIDQEQLNEIVEILICFTDIYTIVTIRRKRE